MCKTLYAINVERNLQKAKELISIILENDMDNGYPERILNLSIDLGVDADLIGTYIDRVKDIYNKDSYYKLMFDFYLYKQEYSLAIDSIKNAYSEGMGLDEFCIKNTFALLVNEEYEQVISFIEMNIDSISSLTDKDVLIINRELANQKLNRPINEMAVNNVIGHKFNDQAILCAHCILSDTKSHEVKANALLKKYYENNYRNILMFKRWPAIPKSMIQKITYENAANKTANDTSEYITNA